LARSPRWARVSGSPRTRRGCATTAPCNAWRSRCASCAEGASRSRWMSEPSSEPAPAARDHGAGDAAADLFARWMEDRAAGSALAFEDLLASHAECASELGALREDWEILQRLGNSPSFAERLRERYGESADPRVTLAEAAPDSVAAELLTRLSGRSEVNGRYRLKGELARGGQGAVMLVWDEDLRRN